MFILSGISKASCCGTPATTPKFDALRSAICTRTWRTSPNTLLHSELHSFSFFLILQVVKAYSFVFLLVNTEQCVCGAKTATIASVATFVAVIADARDGFCGAHAWLDGVALLAASR